MSEAHLLFRVAHHIHVHLATQRQENAIGLPTERWNELQHVQDLLAEVTRRGWHAAAAHLRLAFERQCTHLQRRLEECRDLTREAEQPYTLATTRALYEELRALEGEFGNVLCDFKERTVAVDTEAIVLEGIDLGRFRIHLPWDQVGSASRYRIQALDPNPAASKSDVNHPHVSDESLCEGDGQAAIGKALAQGRLFDFFVLVRQTLETYNDGSAYVSLAEWHGTTCRDCGRVAAGDEVYPCEGCQEELCSDCSYGCERCGTTRCNDCRCQCTGCDAIYCADCLKSCSACANDFCRRCLTDGQCKSCLETETHDEPIHEQTAPSAPLAGPEIQSVCMGQAAVSA